MSKSGLFAHFGSKQELQLAIVEAAAQRFRDSRDRPGRGRSRRRPRGCGRWPRAYIAHLESDGYSGRLLLGRDLGRVRRPPGPVRDAIAAALDAWLGELERQARIAGVAEPERLAFELYALVMGANSRFRLSGDRRVFAYARESAEALLAELPN